VAISRQRNFRHFAWEFHSVFTSHSEIFATLSGIIIGFLRSKNSPAALLGSFTVSLLRTAKFSSTHPNLLYILSIIAYSQTIRREFCSRKKTKLRPLSKHGTFFRYEKSVRQKIKYFADAKKTKLRPLSKRGKYFADAKCLAPEDKKSVEVFGNFGA